MIRSTVRSALVALSSVCAKVPIEVITATFIIVTLTYFQILQAIKGSDLYVLTHTHGPKVCSHNSFTLPSSPAPPARPVHLVRLADGVAANGGAIADAQASPRAAGYVQTPLFAPNNDHWAPLTAAEFRRILEANALEGGYVMPTEEGGNKAGERAEIVIVKSFTIAREDGDDEAMENWRRWLLSDVGVTVRDKKYTYADVCYGVDCAGAAAPKLEFLGVHPYQATLTLTLRAPAPDTPSFTYISHLARLPAFTSTSEVGTNTTLRVSQPPSEGARWGILPNVGGQSLFSGLGNKQPVDADSITAVRNFRWFAYAIRALIVRFYTLARVSNMAPKSAMLTCRMLTRLTSLSSSSATSSCMDRLFSSL